MQEQSGLTGILLEVTCGGCRLLLSATAIAFAMGGPAPALAQEEQSGELVMRNWVLGCRSSSSLLRRRPFPSL